MLSTAYDFLAVFEDLYDAVTSELKSQGFVCFEDFYEQYNYCEAEASCDQFYDVLPDVEIYVGTAIHLTNVTSNEYLLDLDDGKCSSLITKVPSSSMESYILGTPFFRTIIVQLDYQNDYISFVDKSAVSD